MSGSRAFPAHFARHRKHHGARQPHPAVQRESAESLRAHPCRFSATPLVLAQFGGSLCRAPRAAGNRARARILRPSGDFRRSIPRASGRLRQPLDPICELPGGGGSPSWTRIEPCASTRRRRLRPLSGLSGPSTSQGEMIQHDNGGGGRGADGRFVAGNSGGPGEPVRTPGCRSPADAPQRCPRRT